MSLRPLNELLLSLKSSLGLTSLALINCFDSKPEAKVNSHSYTTKRNKKLTGNVCDYKAGQSIYILASLPRHAGQGTRAKRGKFKAIVLEINFLSICAESLTSSEHVRGPLSDLPLRILIDMEEALETFT